ncbi:hypothetical protein [Lentibacillus sp. CBA3610]|uniref:hypothetical protein n=1 Tax=Lentibacillus sp. CBA3610 TaxID=2518176 RepID=UPI001595237C|nr:hypothetical protein [Lentibacillus sp. CBA3610]QKY70219.1 hypothetical protein Len3610_11990 [Lentibacillus sp. CBA3610]
MGFTDVLLPDDVRNEKLLKADPLYDRLSESQREEAIAAAVLTGEKYAVWVHRHFKETNIIDVLHTLGVQVKCEQVPDARLIPYSIYHVKTQTITLNVNIIEALVEDLLQFSSDIPQKELFQNVVNVILFHELFHHLEEARFGKASKQYKARVINFSIFSISSGIKALSEIGAHTFTKACIGDLDAYLNISTKEVFHNGF